MLLRNLLLLLFFLPDIFIVSPGFFKGWNEVIKDSKELVTLGCCWILREQAAHSVKLWRREELGFDLESQVIRQNKRSIWWFIIECRLLGILGMFRRLGRQNWIELLTRVLICQSQLDWSDCQELTRAFMSVKTSSSSVSLTWAVVMNSFMTGRYLSPVVRVCPR